MDPGGRQLTGLPAGVARKHCLSRICAVGTSVPAGLLAWPAELGGQMETRTMREGGWETPEVRCQESTGHRARSGSIQGVDNTQPARP